MRFAAIGVGAVLGANLRYAVANGAATRWGAEFPYGTLFINVSGAFVIGVFLALLASRTDINPLWRFFFATGFLGGYTTFSSYAWEALMLARDGAWMSALLYVGASNLFALAGVWLGSSLVGWRA